MSTGPSRRDVLKAGAAAGAALGLADFQAVLRGALAAPACGSLNDVEHVIFLIQENRSFDQYYGRYKGVRGFDDRSVRLHLGDDGTTVFRQPSPNGVAGPHPLLPFRIVTSPPSAGQGDCINDVQHQWIDEHDMWDSGMMDRWIARHVVSDGAPFAPITMGFYDGSPARDGTGEMDFYWALADNFTICDAYHCSVIGGTDANRLYSMTGTIDPDAFDGGGQFLDTQASGAVGAKYDLGTGGRWVPYPQVLDAHRDTTGAAAPISWKVYSSPDQPSPVSDNVLRYFPQYRPGTGDPQLSTKAFAYTIANFVADCAAGTLPQVSWILANATDSEHAPASVLWGQDFSHTVLTALMGSSLWPKSALFLTYDENGGFFDHVPPPTPPPAPNPLAAGEYLDVSRLSTTAKGEAGAFAAQPIGLGFRVPMLVISPFSRNPNPAGPPLVCSDTFDHVSLLKFVERRFGAEIPSRDVAARRPGLSPWRRDNANIGDLTSAFNFAGGLNTSAVTLPSTSHVDPRSLAECPVTATSLGTTAFTTPYPVPEVIALPVQERSPGPVLRPSGVCAATTGAGTPSPAPSVAAGNGGMPNTSGDPPALPVALVVAGAGALALARWARRRTEAKGGGRPT